MPVHHHARDRHLDQKGLTNYWGYNSFGYFAPERRLAASRSPAGAVREFKRMVRALHAAGLEVILDVVYNHTAEGNHLGPTLSLKGIDNASYYRLAPDDPRYYMDFTGCGNTLNMRSPQVLQLIMDSLRYWVLEMHVDGFRFDLASALARELFDVDRLARVLRHHPPGSGAVAGEADRRAVGPRRGRLSGRQLPGAVDRVERQVSRHGAPLLARRRRHGVRAGDAARRAATTCTRTAAASRTPASTSSPRTTASRSHDLVSYNEKHNEANGEENRDGENNNLSWNCGVEGPTDDPAINALRARQKRNFLATLLLSQGVPMISHGDELGRTQRGNNNAYCQDNEITWIDWDLTGEQKRASRVHAQARRASGCRSRCCAGASTSRDAASAAAASRTWRGSRPTAAR